MSKKGMQIGYISDVLVTESDYNNLLSLYVAQMRKTADLQEENIDLHNMICEILETVYK